jgi:nuclear pore complex protein Nup205
MLQLYPLQSGEEKLLNAPVIFILFLVGFWQAPKADDRAQVVSREVRLPNAPPTILDDQDAQIALKLSDDYNLNEIDCVGLIVSAHQEWNLLGREPLEVLRLAAGLWFTERRALITSLQLLLRAVVLDEELDPNLVTDIQNYVEKLLDSGLRSRLISLIKELNREEPAGLGGPGVEPYVMDSRGVLVQRRNVIHKERLSICHCLVLTCLIVRISTLEHCPMVLVYFLHQLQNVYSVMRSGANSDAGATSVL